MSRFSGRGYGVVVVTVLGLGLILTFVLGRTYSGLSLDKEPFDRTSYVPSFDPINDVTLGLGPNSTNLVAATPDSAIRAIVVYPTQTVLLAAGKPVRSLNTPAPATLRDLVNVVGDPDWISATGTTVTLRSAVILDRGSAMQVAAPVTTEVVMTVRDGVFLGVKGSRLDVSGVYVHAADAKVPSMVSRPAQTTGRPFVFAVENSTMNIDHSTFRYLGRDWNSSYGLTWSKGSTGSVTNSLLEHNFIGVYTNGALGLEVSNNRLYHNTLYGIDPHSGSTRLLIEKNTANFNGRHGIIFSDHVTDGIVRYNTTVGNGLNGIMMDETSTRNQIYGNLVTDNLSDGIVTAESTDNVITDNRILRNRVGINLRGTTENIQVRGNLVQGNKLAGQGTDLSGNKLVSNGGQWSVVRIQVIWTATSALLLVLLAVTWASQRRTAGQHRRGQFGPMQTGEV